MFIVEIRSVTVDGNDTAARRFDIMAINPSRALRHARSMLQDWKKRHPSQAHARVLNAQGVELYTATE